MSDSLKDLAEKYTEVMNSPRFDSLDKKERKRIFDAISRNTEEENGVLGKFFGNKLSNAIVYITLIICVIILIIGIIVLFAYKEFATEYWSGAFPIITGALGYMYGKSDIGKI